MSAIKTLSLLLLLTLAVCLLVSCRSRQSDGKSVGIPTVPAWRWSEPYYAPPGTNVACGAGGRACR